MSPSKIIQSWLIQNTLAGDPLDSAPTWPCYMVSLPEGTGVPSDAVCVYDTTPVPDGRLLRTGEQIVHPGIQIKVRSQSYQAGWDKAQAIAETLDAATRAQVSVDSVLHTMVAASRISGPVSLGVDPSSIKRTFSFTLNYRITL